MLRPHEMLESSQSPPLPRAAGPADLWARADATPIGAGDVDALESGAPAGNVRGGAPLPRSRWLPPQARGSEPPADDARFLCRCLEIAPAALDAAVAEYGLRTLEDVVRCTGAGDGCTACHLAIRRRLPRESSALSTL